MDPKPILKLKDEHTELERKAFEIERRLSKRILEKISPAWESAQKNTDSIRKFLEYIKEDAGKEFPSTLQDLDEQSSLIRQVLESNEPSIALKKIVKILVGVFARNVSLEKIEEKAMEGHLQTGS